MAGRGRGRGTAFGGSGAPPAALLAIALGRSVGGGRGDALVADSAASGSVSGSAFGTFQTGPVAASPAPVAVAVAAASAGAGASHHVTKSSSVSEAIVVPPLDAATASAVGSFTEHGISFVTAGGVRGHSTLPSAEEAEEDPAPPPDHTSLRDDCPVCMEGVGRTHAVWQCVRCYAGEVGLPGGLRVSNWQCPTWLAFLRFC